MGDEQRACVHVTRAVESDASVRHRDPGQPLQPRVVDLEGEQRRHRRLDRVAQLRGPAPTGRRTAGREQYPVGSDGLAALEPHGERAVASAVRGRGVRGRDVDHRRPGAQLHAGRCGGFEQAGDDGLRVVGDREHAAVGLGLERHAAALEPHDGLALAEAVERAAQCPPTPRVVGDEERRVGLVVRHVAAPAARDAHLGERVAALEYGHVRVRVGLGAGDRSEEAGGSAAHDHDTASFPSHPAIVRRFSGSAA